jgi:hypothetical protein
VGDYAIQAAGTSSNYDITFDDGTLSVTPAPLTVTVDDQTRTYGAANPTLSYTASGFVLGQGVSALNGFGVSTPATQSSDVGDYAIQAAGTSSNYDITFDDGTLSVTPAPLTVTVDDQTRTYGAANPTLSYTASGFVLGQDASALQGFAITTTATQASNVGSYALRASGTSLNYDVKFLDGTLTIDPAPLTIDVHDQTRTYGEANAPLAYTATGFVLGQGIGDLGNFSIQTSATQRSDVGAYPITVSASTSNYALSAHNGTLTVNPAPLSIVLHDADRLYGSANPEFQYTAKGFVLGEDISDVPGFAITTAANSSSGVGTYAITGKAKAGNYAVDVTDATLSVDPAPLSVSVADAVRAFGSPNLSYVLTVSGFVNAEDESVFNGNLTVSDSTNSLTPAGTYADALTPGGITAGNYNIDFVPGTLTITPLSTGGTQVTGGNGQDAFNGQTTALFAASQYLNLTEPLQVIYPFDRLVRRPVRARPVLRYRPNPAFRVVPPQVGGFSSRSAGRVWAYGNGFTTAAATPCAAHGESGAACPH